MKIIASSSITSCQREGEKVEAVRDFIFLGSKITVDSDYSHEIKTLALWEEINDKSRECIKKQRHHLPIKVDTVKAIVFPVVMYGCQSWTIKKTERWRIDAFELWCWRRLLTVPWTARGSNQSTLKEHRKKLKSLSHVQLFATPWTVGYQAPPSMEFSRQEYWSG